MLHSLKAYCNFPGVLADKFDEWMNLKFFLVCLFELGGVHQNRVMLAKSVNINIDHKP